MLSAELLSYCLAQTANVRHHRHDDERDLGPLQVLINQGMRDDNARILARSGMFTCRPLACSAGLRLRLAPCADYSALLPAADHLLWRLSAAAAGARDARGWSPPRQVCVTTLQLLSRELVPSSTWHVLH